MCIAYLRPARETGRCGTLLSELVAPVPYNLAVDCAGYAVVLFYV